LPHDGRRAATVRGPASRPAHKGSPGRPAAADLHPRRDDHVLRQRLERQIAVEEERHWDLRAEYARLQAPDRITERAAELGLVYPDDRQTIEVTGIESSVGGPEDRWMNLRAHFVEQP
jgi:hypothetical protein